VLKGPETLPKKVRRKVAKKRKTRLMPDVELSEIKSLEPNNQDRQQDESDLEPIFPIESPNESIKEQASNNHLNIISSNVSHEDNQVGSASHQSERAVNNEIEVSP
jgi:hypothetical protein